MKTFKKYINEDVNLSANVQSGKIDLDLSAVRDNINAYLNGVTSCTFVTPYIALERVSKVLANYHIFLPKYTFMEGDSGLAVFGISQFGGKMGMNDDGEVVTSDDSPFSFYFEYNMNDRGTFDVFAEIVDEDELQELLDDLEDEFEEEDEEGLNEQTAAITGGSTPPATGAFRVKLRSKSPNKALMRGLGVAGVAYDAASTATERAKKGQTASQVATGTASQVAGGVAGGYAGAKAGAALGALGGPAAPVTVPLGALAGGIAGYVAGSKLSGKAHDTARGIQDKAKAAPQQQSAPASTQKTTTQKFDDGSTLTTGPGRTSTSTSRTDGGARPGDRTSTGTVATPTSSSRPAPTPAAPQSQTPTPNRDPKNYGSFSTNNNSKYGFAAPGSDDDTAANFFASDKRMRDAQAMKEQTVQEDKSENKEKKREVLKKLYGKGKKNLRDIRSQMKDRVNREFDPRQMKVAEACWEGMTEACWEGYRKKGMKKMFGKMYPNCVKVDEEAKLAGPETGSRLTTGSNQGTITTGITIPNSLSGKMKKKLKEEKFTNRVPSANPYGNLDAAKKEMNKPKPVPTRSTDDLDHMNRDKKGNTVVEQEQIDEISRDLASRYIKKAKESTKDAYYGSDAPTMGKRNKGIDLALMKKWGDKKYGLPEPKVKATNEESVQIDEVSKKTLASYIKKASHDVATKSAATGRYAERANKEEDNRKKNQDYSGYQQGRKDNAFADKMFDKSWKRRKGIAKAADKLSKD